ncbi:MAG: hypothetical protein WBH28_03580, partial [Fuerstiella sp.]
SSQNIPTKLFGICFHDNLHNSEDATLPNLPTWRQSPVKCALAIAYVVPLLPTERRSIDEIRLEYNSGSVRLTVLGFTRDL